MSITIIAAEEDEFNQWVYELSTRQLKSHEWPGHLDKDDKYNKLRQHCGLWPHFNLLASNDEIPETRVERWHNVMHDTFDPVYDEINEWSKEKSVPLSNAHEDVDHDDIGDQSFIKAKGLWINKSPELKQILVPECIERLHHLHPSALAFLEQRLGDVVLDEHVKYRSLLLAKESDEWKLNLAMAVIASVVVGVGLKAALARWR